MMGDDGGGVGGGDSGCECAFNVATVVGCQQFIATNAVQRNGDVLLEFLWYALIVSGMN